MISVDAIGLSISAISEISNSEHICPVWSKPGLSMNLSFWFCRAIQLYWILIDENFDIQI